VILALRQKDETNVLINRITFQFHNIVRSIEAAFSKGSKQFRGMYYYLVKLAIKYIPVILLAYCVCAKSRRVEGI
jgi:hypothetical protein